MNSETRVCANCKNPFTIEPEDFAFYEKMNVPAPTWCPECRLVRRLLTRNERSLYRRICDLCKQEKIVMYPSGAPFIVYCRSCWNSGSWDAETYAKEYDFSKSFFEQFKELLHTVPRSGILQQKNMVGSEYTNRVSDIRNSYLIFGATSDENCLYGSWVNDSKECVDCYNVAKSEKCYECIDCVGCYNLRYSRECAGCTHSSILLNCRNCESCFGCVNLRNKKYCIFNKQYSKEEYEKQIAAFSTGSKQALERIKGRFQENNASYLVPSIEGHHNTRVSGNWLEECKDTHHAFSCRDVENGRYLFAIVHAKDVMDYTHFGRGTELIYESANIGYQSSSIFFSNECWEQSSGLQYSMNCINSQNMFGCIGMRNKQYCILNKQYDKESFEILKAKIIEHMSTTSYTDKKNRTYKYGEFFPPEILPFAYNETIAQDFFPITKEQAEQQGYRWVDPEQKKYLITLQADLIPDSIRLVADTIMQETIGCAHAGTCNEQCTTAFRIIPQELQFYRTQNLPLPRLCPNCRHYERLKQRNPLKLWHRKCTCGGEKSSNGTYQNQTSHFHSFSSCPNEFETFYAPDRPEIVYCEPCYQAEVV